MSGSGDDRGTSGTTVPVGEDIGGYIVDGELGSGTMGIVYSASHPVIGKRAAIKVLRPELSRSPGAVERFVMEARAVNQIGHPNIVNIFGFGTLPDGRSYYVMDLLVGESLHQRIVRGGPLHVGEAASIIDEIASALIAAHDKGIVHRDLKPDNVFLVDAPGRWPRASILDWGLLKLSSTQSSVYRAKHKTLAGAMLGTPVYMSPEQARGADKVDGRTDVYSLGVMSYEMLAGSVPFGESTSIGTILAHQDEAVPSLARKRPSVPGELVQLIEAMLAKVPEGRPTLAAVRAVIKRLQASKILVTTAAGLMLPAGGLGGSSAVTPPAPAPRRAKPATLAGSGSGRAQTPTGQAIPLARDGKPSDASGPLPRMQSPTGPSMPLARDGTPAPTSGPLPRMQTPVPQAPVPQGGRMHTPVPQAGVPQGGRMHTPVPQAGVPQGGRMHTPVPQASGPQNPAAQAPAASTPWTPASSQQNPSPQAPAASTPWTPASSQQSPQAPAASTPWSQAPAPQTPSPQAPWAQPSSPQTPTPQPWAQAPPPHAPRPQTPIPHPISETPIPGWAQTPMAQAARAHTPVPQATAARALPLPAPDATYPPTFSPPTSDGLPVQPTSSAHAQGQPAKAPMPYAPPDAVTQTWDTSAYAHAAMSSTDLPPQAEPELTLATRRSPAIFIIVALAVVAFLTTLLLAR